ncbi:MAG: hypothetical protein CMM44_06515 [Rhodospirillaceae bacterium]|nr:hypothetical protein [Rhodospirillaceae bacterium]
MNLSDAKYVDVKGIRTRYFEKGTGRTVILFHGGNFGSPHAADCVADWNLNFDGLSQGCRVIAVDKIGQGLTDNPKKDEDYTMETVVQHALNFLEILELEECYLVGHSRGAYLTCRMTLINPDRIKANIMVDTSTLAPGQGRNHIVFSKTPKPFLTRKSQRWVLENYSYNPGVVTESWLDELVKVARSEKYLETVYKMQSGLLKNMFLPELGRQKADTFKKLMLKGTSRPNFLIWGLNDPTASIDQGFALYDLLAKKQSQTEMHIFNHAGHFSYREHPKAFNRLLIDYVNSF